jgi:hypothetical protein
MRKILVLLFAVCLIGGAGGISHASEFSPNITGDVIFTEGESLQGIGTDLATWQDGALHLRLGYATALQEKASEDYTTVGLGINIPKLIEKAGGDWVAVKLNPSLGIMGLLDLNGDNDPQLALYINVLRLDF